jgi:hypothetical protein
LKCRNLQLGERMSANTRFRLMLSGVVVAYFIYGLMRFRLGVDLTDEGAYVAWPLRTLFGERVFTADLHLLFRPVFSALDIVYRIYPEITLYEFRLLGWSIHLGAFSVLSLYLFRLSGGAFQSLCIASGPFFICHIFGVATPGYNSLASDFFLLALSLWGLAEHRATLRPMALHLTSGLCLFVATLAHPALGVIAAIVGLNELFRRRFLKNLVGLQLSPSNAGYLTFAMCWVAYVVYSIVTGAVGDWWERYALHEKIIWPEKPGFFYLRLLGYALAHQPLVTVFFGVYLMVVFWLKKSPSVLREIWARRAHAALGLGLGLALFFEFVTAPESLPLAFAMVSLMLTFSSLGLARSGLVAADSSLVFRNVLSVLAALILADVTFYFLMQRSWLSGVLALPFAFAVGLTLHLQVIADRVTKVLRLLTLSVLGWVVLGAAFIHFHRINRDQGPEQLVATFQTPKLYPIRSSPERVKAVDALCAYLGPRLSYGEPLLAYDHFPMLYFLLNAKPAYPMTWAANSDQRNFAVSKQMDEEFRAQGLPRYAVRTLINVSSDNWLRTPLAVNYRDYPLNQTVEKHYVLEKVIYPFEILRRRED